MMPRITSAVAVAVAVTLWAGAPAVAQTPPLSVKVSDCETGLDPADRVVAFTGSMPREGADVMAMRFELQERLPGAGWERVDVPGWGEWIRAAKRGVPGFIFTKRLVRLAAPAAFRTVVTFRWSRADGSVLRTERRTSRSCRQPDWRPDLDAASVTIADDGEGARIVVRNRGRGPAGAFAVHAAHDGLVRGRTIAQLAAGEQASVFLRLGRCPAGESVTVTVDPADAVEETAEDDNVTTVACPARSPGRAGHDGPNAA